MKYFYLLTLVFVLYSCANDLEKYNNNKTTEFYSDFPVPIGTEYTQNEISIDYKLPSGFSIVRANNGQEDIKTRSKIIDINVQCVCVEGQGYCEVVLPKKCAVIDNCTACQVSISSRSKSVSGIGNNDLLFVKREGKKYKKTNLQFIDNYEEIKNLNILDPSSASTNETLNSIVQQFKSKNNDGVLVPIRIEGKKTFTVLSLEKLIDSEYQFMYVLNGL